MSVFQKLSMFEHEQVVYCNNPDVGLKAIIAIHDTTLGPALGGCRMWPYASEEEALVDVLRLSRGMTYKTSAAGVNMGGGKAVIIGDPRVDKSEELFRAFGQFVQSLGGRYITAEDVGIGPQDLTYVAQETSFLVGLPEHSGNPAPATAFGILRGIQASLKKVFGDDSLDGRKIAIQGAGQVGYYLSQLLREEGAEIIITDIYPERADRIVEEFGARKVDPEAIYDVECDVFAPCALGGIINDDTVSRLRCRIVAGSANNQLLENRHAAALAQRQILYAPDYVINSGGVINVSEESHPEGYSWERAKARIHLIYDKLLEIYELSEKEGISTAEAADKLAEARIRRMRPLKKFYLANS